MSCRIFFKENKNWEITVTELLTFSQHDHCLPLFCILLFYQPPTFADQPLYNLHFLISWLLKSQKTVRLHCSNEQWSSASLCSFKTFSDLAFLTILFLMLCRLHWGTWSGLVFGYFPFSPDFVMTSVSVSCIILFLPIGFNSWALFKLLYLSNIFIFIWIFSLMQSLRAHCRPGFWIAITDSTSVLDPLFWLFIWLVSPRG